jgi:type IV secretion system protein VirB10
MRNRPASEPASDATSAEDADSVRGERAVIPSIHREQSLQARVNHLAAGLALVLLAAALLFWYYGNVLAKQREAEVQASRAADARAAGDVKLPPLPRVEPPRPLQAVLGPPPDPPRSAAAPSLASGQPPPPTPEELALQRRLRSPVLFAGGAGASASPAAPVLPAVMPGEMPVGVQVGASVLANGPVAPASDLGARLQATLTPAVRAQRLANPRMLLPKGAFIDCTLETALDSTLPGMTTCITAVDIFGADGQIVLLERGSKLVGETRGELRQGQARVFVLWTEARTPHGVVIALASPGTDELGRSGLPGAVDTHFWDRFGAAILLSLIDGAVQAAVTAQRSDGGPAVIVNPQGTRDIMTEVLRNTINVPPTVVKHQGERIQVLVARDADFSSVYALRSAP